MTHTPGHGGLPPTGDPTVDGFLAGSGGGLASGEPLGGIFSGPTGPVDPMPGPGEPQFVGPYRQTNPHGIGNFYSADDVTSLWAGLPLEDRVRLQDELVSLGLTSKVIPGEFDDGTMAGIERLFSLSNREGTTWQATVGRLRSLESRGMLDNAKEEEYEPQPYLRPDYAAMAQDVKATFRQRLGRDPDEYELQQLTTELSGFDAMAYEREEELRRMQHDQAATPGIQGGGSATAVDPMARFRERFEDMYAGELDFVEDKQEAAETEQIMQQTAATVSQAARSSF